MPLCGAQVTAFVTVMLGGQGVIFTVRLHVNGQLSQDPVTVNVNEPEAPAVTLTDGPPVEPTMVPLPLMLQVCVSVPMHPVTLTV